MEPTIFILRKVSGAGGSTLAEYLCDLAYLAGSMEYEICEADQYFTDAEGNYNFVPEKIGVAHKYCRDKFDKAINNRVELIIVSNTNTKVADFQYYDEVGRAAGYRIFYLVVENRHGGVNLHGVEHKILERQEKNILNSLKLL